MGTVLKLRHRILLEFENRPHYFAASRSWRVYSFTGRSKEFACQRILPPSHLS